MGKRRRERDRPKNTHDAPYDPNKRVLLSYASDDEEAQDAPVKTYKEPAPVQITPAPFADPTIPQTSRHTGAESDSSDGESTHRRLFEEAWEDDDDAGNVDEAAYAEHAPTNKSKRRQHAHANEAAGQRPALGHPIKDDNGHGSEAELDSEDEEAMAYLEAVRSERQGLATVLKAPRTYSDQDLYESGEGDTRGYYDDGAYVARASLGPQLGDLDQAEIEPQEAFTRVLKQRFYQQREVMHRPPDAIMLAKLDESPSTSNLLQSVPACIDWIQSEDSKYPLTAHIQAMQQSAALRLIGDISKRYLVRGTDIAAHISAWIWSLLARLDDVGTLNNDQVWRIRELGRQAILVQLSFQDPSAAEQLELVASEGESTTAPVDSGSSVEPHPTRRMSAASIDDVAGESDQVKDDADATALDPGIRQNTLATLHTIIAVVGEAFGQRDLLEFRPTWNA